MSKAVLFDIEQSKEFKENQNKYSRKVGIPQYLPKNKKPSVHSLCNTKKYFELIQKIHESNVTEDEKEFLLLAATRHIIFNYEKIADYYSHSNKDMQTLMENSALVIIDLYDAIANEYAVLEKRLIKESEAALNIRKEKLNER